jgi:hypothetical protein
MIAVVFAAQTQRQIYRTLPFLHSCSRGYASRTLRRQTQKSARTTTHYNNNNNNNNNNCHPYQMTRRPHIPHLEAKTLLLTPESDIFPTPGGAPPLALPSWVAGSAPVAHARSSPSPPHGPVAVPHRAVNTPSFESVTRGYDPQSNLAGEALSPIAQFKKMDSCFACADETALSEHHSSVIDITEGFVPPVRHQKKHPVGGCGCGSSQVSPATSMLGSPNRAQYALSTTGGSMEAPVTVRPA